MKKPLQTPEKRAFPIRSITIDTFDKNLVGIREHELKFATTIMLSLDDTKRTYGDLLKDFASFLILEKQIVLDEGAVLFYVKTNRHKKVSISGVVDLRNRKLSMLESIESRMLEEYKR